MVLREYLVSLKKPWVNLFVAQKWLRCLVGKREQGNLAVHWLVLVYLNRWC